MHFKRILIVAFVAAGLVGVLAIPASADTVQWTGNGTTDGFCDDPISDPDVSDQVWHFVLTRPGAGPHELRATFDDGAQTVAGTQSGKNGAVHFYVSTSVGAQLLAAEADDGQGNSVLTVSHCLVPPEAFEACSPGFWMNHRDLFDDTTLFNDVFGALVDPGWTLGDALDNPGGSGSEPNPFNANFVGTGAYLSALQVNFAYDVAFVVQAVQDAHNGDGSGIALLDAEFADPHDCPLG